MLTTLLRRTYTNEPRLHITAGNAAEKTRKLYQAKVDAINALEPGMQALSDEALRGKTKQLQDRYQDGQTLDALLPEAFAVRPPSAAQFSHRGSQQQD